MFEKYQDYNVTLPGYKMELLLECLKSYELDDPSLELYFLINQIENAKKIEISEEV